MRLSAMLALALVRKRAGAELAGRVRIKMRILSPAREIRQFSARLAFVLWSFGGDVFFVPLKRECARRSFDGLEFGNVVGDRRAQLGELAC
jgi:hypothetical protein